MENENKPKLGGGIIALSVIQLIIYILMLIGTIFVYVSKDKIIEILNNSGTDTSAITKAFSTTNLIIGLVLTLLLIIGIILILSRKVLGVYIYFLSILANLIVTIVSQGFSAGILIQLILPVLTAIFIFQKKEIYGFGNKNANINM
ncbi:MULTISPECIES: hypothetical protein [Clostridium]|uniref:hypothetical protein n=1 Tax=Clostridium TaxID=1485 RepID=UPI0008244FA7|nr:MULTISPECIES: hypothetical protein [Clostridium]PJI09680.1 hypothetical protein CUB90_18220 [Clostridium sp. CT7]